MVAHTQIQSHCVCSLSLYLSFFNGGFYHRQRRDQIAIFVAFV